MQREKCIYSKIMQNMRQVELVSDHFLCFKGTLMQIWKSFHTFVFMWKIVSHRLPIITPSFFSDMCTLDMCIACLQT